MKAVFLLMQFAFTCSKRWALARALPQPMEGFPNFVGFWRTLPFQNKGWDVYLTLIQVWVILKDYRERTSKEYIHFYCYLCQSIELKKNLNFISSVSPIISRQWRLWHEEIKGLYRVEEFKEYVDLIQGQHQNSECDLFCKMFSLKKVENRCAEFFCVNSYHWIWILSYLSEKWIHTHIRTCYYTCIIPTLRSQRKNPKFKFILSSTASLRPT